MKIIKYLLRCLPDGIAATAGRPDLVTENLTKLIIGGLEVIIIFSFFLFFQLRVFNNKKLKWLWSLLSTIAVILVFCLLCIFIEFIIK